MSIRFNTLCLLLKKLQIKTKNDIKRLETVIPSVISAINEHPAHTSLLLYHLSKSTSIYNNNNDCKTCKGLCNITFQVLSSHVYELLDSLSPKALAQILKIYSTCLNDTKITNEVQLRLCYFMLSHLKFPKNYLSDFCAWTSKYKKSAHDYLNSTNSSNQSNFYLPLVVHDVADLVQSLHQFLSRQNSKIHLKEDTKLVLDVSLDYIGSLLKSDLTQKDIHGITRIFYYYNELNYFSDRTRKLWLAFMGNFINSMNMYDICTMLHAMQSPLDKFTNLVQLLESRLKELFETQLNFKSISMILNALFKCNIYNTSIPNIAHSKTLKLINSSNILNVELFQVIKMLIPFDLNVDDMILLLHKRLSNSNSLDINSRNSNTPNNINSRNNIFKQFDLHDITIILNWYNTRDFDSKHIIDSILELDDLIAHSGTSKFENIYRFTIQLYESSLLNDRLIAIISKSLSLLNPFTDQLDKLIRLYEIFESKNTNSIQWAEERILEVIRSGNLVQSLKTPLSHHPKFANALKQRIETEFPRNDTPRNITSIANTSRPKLDINLLIKLCRSGALYNMSMLPLEYIIKQCNIQQLSILLKYIPGVILPILDIQAIVDNIKRNDINKNLALWIYKCILNGIRGESAGTLIDYFIDCRFSEFKELMMISIVANLPKINHVHVIKIVDYFYANHSDFKITDFQRIVILNKLIPISLKISYDLADKLTPIGIELINGLEPFNELGKFVCYCIRLDKYRNMTIFNAINTLMDYKINSLNPATLTSLGLVGMQYWGSKHTLKWLNLVKSFVGFDFNTQIQLRMFVNPTEITLIELKVMNDIINNTSITEFDKKDALIIRQVEEAINYACTTTIQVRPKVDILILCE